jgi:hypothetical protein
LGSVGEAGPLVRSCPCGRVRVRSVVALRSAAALWRPTTLRSAQPQGFLLFVVMVGPSG